MLYQKTLFSAICASLILFSSCATIINGPKTKISLNYDAGTEVLVDGKKIQPDVHHIKVKSSVQHNIVMNKEGYKPVTYQLYPSLKPTGILLDLVASVALSVPLYTNIGDNRDGKQMDRLFLALIGQAAIPAIIIGTDALSGSIYKTYPKAIDYKSVKKPNVITEKNQFSLGCSDVNIKLDIGAQVGTISLKGNEKTKIFWDKTVNIKAEELEVIANNNLQDLGFKVPKEIGGKGYLLNAEINSININADMVSGTNISANTGIMNCNLSTRWTLKDISTDEIILSKTIESFSTETSKGVDNSFYSAFENSLFDMLNSSTDIYNVVTKKDVTLPVSNASTITITKPKPLPKGTFKDYIQSVVTIEDEDETRHGSGFFISEDGYIITNAHVVKNNKKLNIILNNGLSFVGEVIRADETYDLALIKINGKGFKPLNIIKQDESELVGTEVYAIGTPADKSLSQTVTKGIISGNRLMNSIVYLQTDVSVSPGSSGGPLVTSKGQVLGVVTSKIVSNGVEGISFALPGADIFDALKIEYK